MSSSSPTSTLNVDVRPGKPPMLRVDATDDAPRWAAEHRDALRAAVVQHGSLLVRGLGLRDVAGTEAVFRRLGSLMTEEGGLRVPAEVLRRRVLFVEVAAQPAHVHAPRAQLQDRVSFPNAVSLAGFGGA